MLIRVIASILLFLAPISAQAWLHGTNFVEPVGSISIPVSSQVDGAISANNWTGFTSPAATVFTSSNWGATNTKYLESNDFHVLVAQTTASARDVEVTTYVRKGTIFLRMFNGTAIYCAHNGETTNGDFSFGIVTGLTGSTIVDSGGALIGSYHVLYDQPNMNGTVAGYNNAATTGAALTCGVSGLTIYAKFNGTQFASVLSNYTLVPGPVGLWADTGHGFRDATVNYLPLAPLFSSPGLARWDPRDWGLKQGQTTGSITGGANTLTLSASLGVAIGDGVIVAVGGESGAGARGTVGVGGNSPTLSFANATAMNLDTTEPNGTYAWTTNNGQAFVSTAGVWARGPFYYTEFTAPRALIANVTGVSNGGLTLTLDTNATVTATNAAVYVNNYAPLNNVLNPSAALPTLQYQTVVNPAGSYAICAPMGATYTPPLSLNNKQGWRILGQGAAVTTLMSPAGCTSASLKHDSSAFAEVANLGIVGNNGANGFGLSWAGNIPINWPIGIMATGASSSSFHDLAVTNVFAGSINTEFSDNATIYNCAIVQQFVPPNGDIEPWYLQVADSTGGGIHDCTFTAPLLTTALEMFRSNAVQFQRITLNNGVLSCNTCGGGFLMEDISINVSALAGVGNTYLSTGPIVTFNGNIGTNPRLSEGGTLNRPTIVQQGYYNNSNEVLPSISLETNNANVSILGTYPAANGKGCIQKPNWFTGTNAFLGIGIRNDAAGLVASGIRIIGDADYAAGHSDVYAEGGSLTSTNNIMDSSVLGAGAITETGTQSNAIWNAANPGHPGC